MMTKKLDHPDFLTFEWMFYDPNEKIQNKPRWDVNAGVPMPPKNKERSPNRHERKEGFEGEESRFKRCFEGGTEEEIRKI